MLSGLSALKNKFRSQIISTLTKLSQQEVHLESEQIAQRVQADDRFRRSRAICIFLSMPFEVQTDPIIKHIFEMKKRCFVPRIVDKQQIEMLEVYSMEDIEKNCAKNSWGIREPRINDGKRRENALNCDELDLVFVPGVAFDTHNRRLGFGRGYYDRWLASVQSVRLEKSLPMPSVIGLAFQCQILPEVPVGERDWVLDAIIISSQKSSQK